jgi:hypothetical protein
MTRGADLERTYRRLLVCYPRRFRDEHGEELLGVLLASARDGQHRPALLECADLIRNGLGLRLRRRGHHQHDRRSGSEPVNTRLTVAAAVATVLASIALYPLMNGGMWFWGGVGAVIVVAVIGAATRRRAIPAILCFLAAIGGLFLYLNAAFAGRQSWVGLVPTGASVRHLQLLIRQAMAETSKYAPPMPPRPGIVLLTVAGIGLVAVLTDVLAVRLHRPAIARLPLLVLFCVPLTTDARPGAVGGTLVFCAGMVGYLGLLSADGRHRLRLWGRFIHPWHDDADSQG